MRNHKSLFRVAVLTAALLLLACATTHAPTGWLPQAPDTQSEAYGGWIDIKYSNGRAAEAELSGELIAIGRDSLFIANEGLQAIALTDVNSARLTIYNSNAGIVGVLAVLGTLSTISNGAFLLFSAPLWILGGSIAAVKRSRQPVIDYPKQDWQQFVPFARFPQGLPAHLKRDQLKAKQAE